MLIQFSVTNFRSIKDKVTLSMLAGNVKEHPEHLISYANEKYLKSAVIYGANASGKSNIIRAFSFMVDFVLNSHNLQLHKKIPRYPFQFDKDTQYLPGKFEVIFISNGICYAYGFSINDDEVIDEYLYHYPKGRQAIIFERSNTRDFRFVKDVSKQNSFKERTSANKLYLSVAANWNYSEVIPAFEWFASCQFFTKDIRTTSSKFENIDFKNSILSMLKVADFGINDLILKNSGDLNYIDSVFPTDNLKTVHRVYDTNGQPSYYDLNIGEESDGTRAYLEVICFAKKALDEGTVFIADEIDAHLHPLLTKHLVSLFNSNESNAKNAQLIFTSHSTMLLDSDTLRRDQIWFTEKEEETAVTNLFSLYDFPIKKGTEIEKGYLLGRYGAIPFIKRGE